MKYRLDSQHYIDEAILETGTEIGDGTDHPYRDAKGKPLPPSTNMTPLDDEAKRLYKEWFKEEAPDRDPFAKIPLQGSGDTVKTSVAPRPGSTASTMPKEPVNPAPTKAPTTGINLGDPMKENGPKPETQPAASPAPVVGTSK